MKKFTIFTLAILFIYLSLLTSCGESQAKTYDLYIKMVENVANAKSIDMDVIGVFETVVNEDEANSFANGNVKKIFHSDTDIDIEVNFGIGVNGETVTNTTSYYHDGLNYYNISGTKYKSEMSIDDALQYLPGISHTDLLEFPEEAIKSYKISNHDGGKKVELTLHGNAVTSLLKKNEGAEELIISDVICEFIIDKKNMLKSYRTIYEINLTIKTEEVYTSKVNYDITIKINSYNDVTINFPEDLDDYVMIYIN